MNNNFPVIEMFHSIQGEGAYMGVPSFFVRVSGCNLRCVFKNSICDTPYSSFNPEKSLYPNMEAAVSEFKKLLQQYPNTSHIVITGGEPMLYQEGMFEFLYNSISGYTGPNTYKVTIETNGTIYPKVLEDLYMDMMYNMVEPAEFRFKLASVSPKLSTSEDNRGVISKEAAERHKKTRLNLETLGKLFNSCSIFEEVQYKFVYSGPECVDEIKGILDKIAWEDERDYINQSVYLMPEGTTVAQMNEKHLECVNACIENGWNFAPRLHILIWGDKRGV